MPDAERPRGYPPGRCPVSPGAVGGVFRRGGVGGVGAPECHDRLRSFLGGGSRGSIGAVTLEDGEKRVLARWGVGEGELAEALAAPIWGRYALFRGHPRITGVLMWDVKERCVLVAGERGGEKFDRVLVSKLVTGTRPASLRETAKQTEQQPCA